ncbi:mechanosensitive ion channel, partial [bacterium]|nr:mechanosensitive ion channel [bacterium]
VVFVYICLVLPIFGVNPSAILAGAGVIGLVVGFAFQDLLNDVVSGFSIVFNNTFDVGDFVDINGNVGNVVNMGIKTTVIRSFTGELCTLNNRLIVNVRNYTKADNALVINYFRLLPTVDLQKVYEIFDQEMDEILVKYQDDIIEKPKIVGTNAIGDRSIEFQVNTVVKPERQWQFRRSLGDELVLMCQRHKLPIPGVSYIIENK